MRKAEEKRPAHPTPITCEGVVARPCPFCDSKDVFMVRGAGHFFVACRDCKSSGPPVALEDTAILHWNVRRGVL
jgi:hypothetical protein